MCRGTLRHALAHRGKIIILLTKYFFSQLREIRIVHVLLHPVPHDFKQFVGRRRTQAHDFVDILAAPLTGTLPNHRVRHTVGRAATCDTPRDGLGRFRQRWAQS